MSIWGKLGGAAAGLALGGPLGGLLGGLAGHYALDRDSELGTAPERRAVFTIGLIALSAKMAKADGVVTSDEVRAFRQIVEISENDIPKVNRVFDLAKTTVVGYDGYARQMAGLLRDDPAILEDVLDGLFHIAGADGVIHERELAYLQAVAEIFGFDEKSFAQITARHARSGRSDPYLVLGLPNSASDEEVRLARRRLVSENHPDRAIARGMPEEFVRIATAKLSRINAAYDQIAQERGF